MVHALVSRMKFLSLVVVTGWKQQTWKAWRRLRITNPRCEGKGMKLLWSIAIISELSLFSHCLSHWQFKNYLQECIKCYVPERAMLNQRCDTCLLKLFLSSLFLWFWICLPSDFYLLIILSPSFRGEHCYELAITSRMLVD